MPIFCPVWGVAIGLAAGALNLIDTAIEPLADDTAGRMSLWFGGLLFLEARAPPRRSCARLLPGVDSRWP